MEFDPELYGFPPLDALKQIAEEFKEKGTREWDVQEEMRKAAEEIRARKIDVDKYQVYFDGYCPYVCRGVLDEIIKLIYRINFLQHTLDHRDYEHYCTEKEIRNYCKELLKRIPPDQRPPPPKYFDIY